MTQDEIIRMAREAGMTVFVIESLERFASLVAAHEREACAKVCGQLMTPWDENTPNGELIALRNDGMRQCAAAIRARGEQ